MTHHLKQLRDADCFTRVVRACPLQAHWLEGQPITSVLAMAGIMDRYRRFAADGEPIVTGFVAVGDAWACTNPSAGRGLSVGLVHSQLLRRTVRDHVDDPATFARAFDDGTERAAAPFYWSQVAADRARIAQLTALRENRTWSPPASPLIGLANGAPHDADLFRAMIETVTCLAPMREVLERPDLRDKLDRWSREPVPGVAGSRSSAAAKPAVRAVRDPPKSAAPIPPSQTWPEEGTPALIQQVRFGGHDRSRRRCSAAIGA